MKKVAYVFAAFAVVAPALVMRKSWEFALAGTGTCIGTAIFAPHERSLHMAKMTAALIAAGIAARIEAMIEWSSLDATIAEMDRKTSRKGTRRKSWDWLNT
jgi:hypothetical protein